MQDVQFNAMTLAAADRAQARRRAEALAEPTDFESTLDTMTAAPAPAVAKAAPVVAGSPAPTALATNLTGAEVDALMANFGKADAAPPVAVASATTPVKPAAPADSAAVAALKSAPAAANLTPEQMTALLSGFGRESGTQTAVARADPMPAGTPVETDTMSATKFFPVQRKAGAPPSLYASAEVATGDAASVPERGRYFPINPTGHPVTSLYATPPEPAPPDPVVARAAPPAGPMPAHAVEAAPAAATITAATARYYPVNGGGHANAGAAATARDTYLRAMDVNARMLGLSSHR